MDEPNSPSNAAEEARARSVDALRALDQRAHSVLSSQQQRMQEIEDQLTQQLDAITAQLAEGLAETSQNVAAAAEVDALRGQLTGSQQAWEAERRELEERLGQRDRQLDELRTQLDQRAAELDAREKELQQLDEEALKRLQECDDRERQLDDRHAEIENNDQITATRTIQIDSREIEITRLEHELHELSAKCDEREQEFAKREEDLNRREKELSKHRDTATSEVSELKEKLAAAERDTKRQREELQNSLTHLEKGYLDQQRTLEEDLASIRSERDKLVEALNATTAELEDAQAAVSGNSDVQQKFELALADVQRMRERNSELEQELARRPELAQGDSVEMVHLRGERDALAERIATLEKQLADPIEVAGDQQLSDLQRRFELAVEDVRHLKTENARLEEKLAAASATPQAVVAADGQDWESQKRRLLASLEDDGDNVGEERRKERASIENTVRITDEVVAEKDREIRELEVRLLANEWAAAATEHTKQKAEKDAATEVLLSNDEIIRQHRVRIAGIEKELDQKLREAELEMSVQRAKIARDQAEIAESKTELETLRAMVGQAGGMENGAAPPKRRWLAKLGLGDDE